MCRRYTRAAVFLCFIFLSSSLWARESELNISLGENFSDLESRIAAAGAGIRPHNDNIIVVTNLQTTVNGVSPSQLLLSLDKNKKIMIIGYFFSSMARQEEAVLKLSPFPLPFKNGYGAGYNSDIIVNASPQSGSFLLSIIDRKLFAKFSAAEEKILIENIDNNYFSGTRPKENSDSLILPGESREKVIASLQRYGAQYENLSNGHIRISSLGKTVLGAWVSEAYVVMSAAGRAVQVFYQFRLDDEGVNFALKLPAVRADAAQSKLLKTKSRFAAVMQDNLFILASPQEGQYRVVLMDVQAVKESSQRNYKEILKTLENAKDLERFTK